MAKFAKAEPPKQNKQLKAIGRAWLNAAKADGKEYLNVTVDKAVGEVTIGPDDRILMFPNAKRDGKKDADWRLMVEVDE